MISIDRLGSLLLLLLLLLHCGCLLHLFRLLLLFFHHAVDDIILRGLHLNTLKHFAGSLCRSLLPLFDCSMLVLLLGTFLMQFSFCFPCESHLFMMGHGSFLDLLTFRLFRLQKGLFFLRLGDGFHCPVFFRIEFFLFLCVFGILLLEDRLLLLFFVFLMRLLRCFE